MHGARSIFESEVSRWLTCGGVVESLCGNRRERLGVLRPQSVADVQCILYAASKAAGAVKIQPVSCGRNWGFGSDLPARDGAYTLELSALKSIRRLDLKGHCVELEPGTTQGQLDDALRRQGSTHYFNVTGAGLGTSVIGNALERGIGYSGQRHLDLLDLEVVLPTGQVARTSRFESLSLNGAYLGGLGPDPTGLFCQSSFGVVTAATVALHRRPEVMGGVICRLADAASFPDLVSLISDSIAEGSCYGVPHVFNHERLVTTLSPHLDPAEAAKLRLTAPSWTALIPIRGSKEVFAVHARHLETLLKPLGQIQILGDPQDADRKLSNLVQGRPSDFALASVAFSVFGHSAAINAPMEASGAGLLHVTPVMALCGQTIADAARLTLETLGPHGCKAVPLSVNALSARTAALIVSIGFDRRSPQKTKEAHRAADDLLEAYLHAGLMPYRLGLGQADRLPQMNGPWPEIFCAIQRAFDPSGCMAPSRYEPLWKRDPAADAAIDSREAKPCFR
jgi:4-cresol dehydrogenase (hydroxylating)